MVSTAVVLAVVLAVVRVLLLADVFPVRLAVKHAARSAVRPVSDLAGASEFLWNDGSKWKY